jgi:hypothetical protein
MYVQTGTVVARGKYSANGREILSYTIKLRDGSVVTARLLPEEDSNVWGLTDGLAAFVGLGKTVYVRVKPLDLSPNVPATQSVDV